MQFKILFSSVLATVASAQSLTAALASQNSTLRTLATLLMEQPELVSTLSAQKNITILAPNDAAFEKLMATEMGKEATMMPETVAAILEYHVLNGTFPSSAISTTPAFVNTFLTNSTYTNVTGGQRVEVVKMGSMVMAYSGFKMNSTVVTADLTFDGGVIHIIDTVLTIPESDMVTAQVLGLSSLAGALQAVELEALNTLKDVTIFAPTNAAFQAVGETLANLSTSSLSKVLEYHVVQNVVGYSPTLKNMSVGALSGEKLMVELTEGKVFVNSAQVIMTDILVSNGVVHVIDNVLNPNNTMAMPIASASTQSVAYSSASSATVAPFTSGITTGIAAAETMNAAVMNQIPSGSLSMGALLGGAAMLMAGM